MRAWAFTFVLVAMSFGCSRKPKHPEVVVTVPAWQSLVCAVAGEDAHVVAAEGQAEPARLVFRNGLGLAELAPSLQPAGKLVTLGDRVPALSDASLPSPYVWTDPQRARLVVQVIGEELARADAARAKEYRTRAKELDAKLGELDAELRRTLTKSLRVPAEARAFAEAYGLDVDTTRSLGAAVRGGAECGTGYTALVRVIAASVQK